MKKIYLFLIGVLGFTFLCNAQYVTLYTPNGSSVQTFIRSEGSTEWITTTTNQYKAAYGIENVLAPASQRYNCHNYAWHMSEGNTEKVWMNQYDSYGNSNVWKYWTDNSYVETTENNAEKIFYYNGDHSAIKSKTIAGKYESKWGSAPLMRHYPTQGPSIYEMSHRRYYRLAYIISGPSQVCSTGATYTINNLPSSVNSVIWTHGSNLTIVSGQNTPNCTFSATGVGASWVRARLVTNYGETLLPAFNTHAGNLFPNVSGPHDASTHQVIGLPQTGKEYYFSVLNPPAQSSYSWELTPQFPCSGRGCTFSGIGNTIWLSFVHEGNYQLTVEQLSPCNQGAVRYVSIYAVPGHYYLLISPNPVSGETTFNIIAGSNEKLYSEIPQWSFEIHDQSQRLVMSKVNLKSESHTINTSGWEKGVYIVTATFKNEKLSQKLVVQ